MKSGSDPSTTRMRRAGGRLRPTTWSKAQAIMKVLDAAVIKMEGGTDHDLRILEFCRLRRKRRERELKGWQLLVPGN
ncbi:hypothetical protein J4Q44_G00124880 [Coregonus suidteri]|uniref:Uncharacterized protein n=1 Tax=Coregonus suidteri TaxID=861788 RepID=A0AAN8QZS0_9TELE